MLFIKNVWSQFMTTSSKKSFSRNELQEVARITEQLQRVRQYQHPMSQPLRDTTFVVFDLETTGFDPYGGDEIIEIGALVVENGKISDIPPFHRYINPNRPIPPVVSELTGITDEKVKGQPTVLPVLVEFLEYIRHYHLVAHCASFDLNFINKTLRKYTKKKLPHEVLDTSDLAVMLHHRHPQSLDDLIEEFNIPMEGRHTALGDARMTALLLIRLLEELDQRNVRNLRDLHYFTQNNRTMLREKGLI
ncbi:MAG: 3'-5' exoribonuclease [Bacillaceae bacterium]|nr:3'-5' exoribonuclease [Bacillaceae bacterium]